MNAARRFHQLFVAGLDADETQRAHLLTEAAALDPAYPAELETLWQSESESDSAFFAGLGRYSRGMEGTNFPREFDDYRLDELIGRGGMGTVFRAYDHSLGREVALKFLSRRGLAAKDPRFDDEARLLAQMSHANIVPIYNSGWVAVGDRLFPYLVMQYSGGVPLDRYCREERPQRKECLHLMLQICDGVQHAHSRGITHRDLKLSNILVTKTMQGVLVQLIDFGLAGREDQGLRGGTQGFMAPELSTASPIVGPISDVYALGVILQVLLGGGKPAGHRSQSQVTPNLGGPVASVRLDGDLEALCAKAVAACPADRYQTVQDFAADIRAWLGFKPLAAVPATAAYRLRKALRRHRKMLSVAAVSLLLLFGAIHAQWRRIHTERENLRLAEETIKSEQTAVRSVAQMEAIIRILFGMFEEVDPSRSGADVSGRELLARAEQLVEDSDDNPSIKGAVQLVVSRIYEEIGIFDKAYEISALSVDSFQQAGPDAYFDRRDAVNQKAYQARRLGKHKLAIYLYRMLLQEADNRERVAFRLVVKSGLSDALLAEGQTAEAAALAEATWIEWCRLEGLDDLRTLAVQDTLARALVFQGEYKRAEALFHNAIDLLERRGRHNHPRLLSALHNLAWCLVMQGRGDEALMREVWQRRNAVLGERHPDTLESLNILTNHLLSADRLGKACDFFGSVYARAGDELTKGNMAHLLGNVLKEGGDYQQAEQLLVEATTIRSVHYGAFHVRTIYSEATLAEIWLKTGRAEDAACEARRLWESAVLQWGPDHYRTRQIRSVLDSTTPL